jgi:formate hydrogenlyase subunit 3/multisubunit Na+/H+ antiporter MnhD subunit
MNETPGGYWLVILMLLPLAAVLLAAIGGGRRARGIVLGALAVGLLAVGALWRGLRDSGDALVYWMGGWSPPLGLALRADGVSVVILATTVLVTGAVAWYAPAKFRAGPDDRETRLSLVFWVLVAGLWTAMNAVALGNDLFNFYVAVELLTFSAVPLVALDGRARSMAAATRYLVFALLGSLLYLLGVVVIYGRYGVLDIVLLREVAEWDSATGLAVGLMTAGLAAKSALFPFHLWLPPAHAGAPSPASALLSALAVKGSFLILVRIWFDMMPPLAGAATAVPAALGAGAVVLGGAMALRQKRLKMLVAYSTVAQIGYLFLIFPLALGSATALPAGIMQVVAHAFAKAAMFLGVGLVVEACGHDRLAGLRGLGGRMPVTVAALGLAGASLIGVPPTGGFAAKWLLVRAAFESGQWLWWLVPAAGGLMAGGYVFRIMAPMVSRADDGEPLVVSPVALSREAMVLALALAALALGLVSDEMVELIGIGATDPGGEAPSP